MKIIPFLLASLLTLVSCENSNVSTKNKENINPIVVGKIIKLRGTVLKNNKKVVENEELFESDTIETKDKTFVKIEMNDSTSINLGAKTKITLKEYKISNLDNRTVVIDLIIGKLKTHFRKKILGTQKGDLKVTSGLSVFGVRGTEFVTESDNKGKTTLLLIEGRVVLKKKNIQDNTKTIEQEIKPLQIVTIEELSQEVKTETVKKEDILEVMKEEELTVDLNTIEKTTVVEEPTVSQEVSQIKTNSPIDSNINTTVNNFLFSLEHSSKALPLKMKGQIVFYEKNDIQNQIIIEPELDLYDKDIKVPVISTNGKKDYISVSSKYLASLLVKNKNYKQIGMIVPNEPIDRKPASND